MIERWSSCWLRLRSATVGWHNTTAVRPVRLVFLLLCLCGLGRAALLPWQGLALEASNRPLADGSHAANFALYSTAVGGSALWSESQTVTTSGGRWACQLGSVTPLDSTLFDGRDLYLEASLDGKSFPRQRLGAVPFARGASRTDSVVPARRADTARYAAKGDSGRAVRHADTALVARDGTALPALQAALASQGDSLTALKGGVKLLADSQAAAAKALDSLTRAIADASNLCGAVAYDSSTQFCLSGSVYSKCGGVWYDPYRHSCVNGVQGPRPVVLSLFSGVYATAQTVRITCASADAAIYYTLDGSDPTTSSTRFVYVGPLSVSYGTTLKAVAVLNGLSSAVAYGQYFISYGVAWTAGISYGTVIDGRDPAKAQTYRTVKIDDQTWFAENLNYKGSGADTVGVCYNSTTGATTSGPADTCAKYGRLYTWAEVMDTSSTYNSQRLNATLPRQGICPSGWHVPSVNEWTTMTHYVDLNNNGQNDNDEMTSLRSKSNWASTTTSTDAYGFRILPAGELMDHGEGTSYFEYINNEFLFWFALENDGDNANCALFRILNGSSYLYVLDFNKHDHYSLRCIRDQTAAPTFTVTNAVTNAVLTGTGPFANSIQVTLSGTAGDSLYYTTDGTSPSTSATRVLYMGTAISVTKNATLKAIAVPPTSANLDNSAVASAAYQIQVAAPTFTVTVNSYSAAQTVQLKSATSGATLYYTLNGSDPTTASSSVASGGTLSLPANASLKAMATATGYANSSVATATQVAMPSIQVSQGSTPTVSMSSLTAGATLYYTTDGTDPSSSSASCASPCSFALPSGALAVKLRALASDSGLLDSRVNAQVERSIPAGSFTMGSPSTETGRSSNETQHSVTLTQAFGMSGTDVTQGQYQGLMGVNPSYFTACGLMCPVEMVTWFDAVLFCNARSRAEGRDTVYSYTGLTGSYGNGVTALAGLATDLSKNGYRLPSEAQWEYAARAGTTTAYFWGSASDAATVSSYAWFSSNAGNTTHPVATKSPNGYGLYDMAGNVWQWTGDWYGTYSTTAVTDPSGPSSGTYRVFRGGSWGNGASSLRSAYRGYIDPGGRYFSFGFRSVRPGS